MTNKNKNPYARLFTKDEYAALTRDGMYEALKYVSPTLAKGKSRAKKEELTDAYADAAATDSIPVLEVTAHGTKPVPPSSGSSPSDEQVDLDVDYSALEMRTAATLGLHPDGSETKVVEPNDDGVVLAGGIAEPHVHGPNCNHELPQLAGVDEFVRVNPEMPSMPIEDGQILHLAPEEDPMFTFKDETVKVTAKEQYVVDRLLREYEKFKENPADNAAKKSVLADIYTLKVAGIIANPKFVESIKTGRAYVRDIRRKHKLGLDLDAAKEA